MTRLWIFSFALASLALAVGCNQSSGPQIVPAGGVVLFEGQPLVGARLIFNPATGRPARGVSDAQGRFQLSTSKPGDGAVVGKHRVAVIAPREGIEAMPGAGAAPAAPHPSAALPQKYSTPDTSELEFEVVAGGKNDFELKLE